MDFLETLGIFTDTNPLTARTRFKCKTLHNCILVGTIFITSAFVLALTPFSFLGDLMVGTILFYFYFFVWDKRAIGIRCTRCDRYVATNTPWICGFCGKRNQKTDDFPFANRCEHCAGEPKAYRCHHAGCGELIFLSEDRQEQGFARSVAGPTEGELQTEIVDQEREKRSKLHELTMADLDEKLESFRRRREMLKEKSPVEEVKLDYERTYARTMAAEDFAEEERERIQREYAKDDRRRERALEVLEDWLKSRA